MKKSRGSEIPNNFNDITINFGTIDKNDPKTMYIKMSGWANVIDFSANKNYGSIIRTIDKRIRSNSYSNIDKSLFRSDNIIVDFDMRESGILGGKPSFFSCEITLTQIKDHKLPSNIIINELYRLTSILIDDVFRCDENFNFHKDKTTAKNKILKPIL